MIRPVAREQTLDLRAQPLGPGWLRRSPTMPEGEEFAGAGVWRTGPKGAFRDALVSALDSASEVALVSSFLLADDDLADAMMRAAKKGVRVYVLTASEQRIGKVVGEDESFEQRMAEQHKKLLESLAGKVLLRSAEHIHAKFLVVDPHSSRGPKAWLSTANFNRALVDSVELGLQLEGEAARGLAACFYWAFWQEAERELRGLRRLVGVRPDHPGTPQRPIQGPVFSTLRDEGALRSRLLAMIEAARSELMVASYGMSLEHPTVKAIVEAAQRGVQVTVLTRPRRAVAAAVAALEAAGATIVAHDKLHAKAVVADGNAIVMTANLESQGLDRGFEVGALLPAATSKVVHATLRTWASSFPWVWRSDATRGEHLGDFCPADAMLRDGVLRVTEEHLQQLAPVVAADALRLDEAPQPDLKPAPPRGELPRRVKFSWQVEAPVIPKEARERLRTVDREAVDKGGKRSKVSEKVSYAPPVFEHRGTTYVRLRSLDEAEAARRLADELGAVVAL